MSQSIVEEILGRYRVVAIIGVSDQIGKPSHRVAAYLKKHGYRIIPVNPTINGLFGEKSYKALADIPEHLQRTIDIVNIFRKSEDVPPIVEQAIAMREAVGRPFVVWMQRGIVNEAAAQMARQAGLVVVMDMCLMEEHLHRQ
ncbi:MAG: CoA-binding protein [Candidatus Bathyarchaeota archaeon]|nr:CoA-binding protein [Candidatus Bathyarchaeota archaeon]